MSTFKKKVFVTQPSMPAIDEFIPYLERIWDNRILTNNGPFHKQFEQELSEYLGINHISVFANGTLALLTALQALKVSGEVITTPFSFIATTHSLWWNNIKPVFVDIEPEYLNLNPELVEAAITSKTTAIMPVHVYGNPCQVDRLKEIADRHGLKLIYDAAHAFGVKKSGVSVVEYGDLSVLSFHATKTFNTFEGGAIVCHSEEMKHHIDNLKNFGFRSETVVEEPGINAKMNEIQAAFGLLQLRHVNEYIAKRKSFVHLYEQRLKDADGIRIIMAAKDVVHSYPYFPILIDKIRFGRSRDDIYEDLKSNNIFARRYFYPLITWFSPYRDLLSADPSRLPVAVNASDSVLCLPLYPDMDEEIVDAVCSIVLKK